MKHTIVTLAFLLSSVLLQMSADKKPSYPFFEYDVARQHEIKPHRRTIPIEGSAGFPQLCLTLIVSPAGNVVTADAGGDAKTLKFWPQLKSEVIAWKFTPFKKHGIAVTAEVEEYIDLVPPERLPTNRVAAPVVRPDSHVEIKLERSGCYGTCPAYTVTVRTDGIVFDGRAFVAACGRHTQTADAEEVRKLAQKFVDADFYSMDPTYFASVTDSPGYDLSITIDGQTKKVQDYVGVEKGMPAVITELEDEVDSFAGTERWIAGSHGAAKKRRHWPSRVWGSCKPTPVE
ncbi:MAG TPA: DUF6438 domain-containing protein [Candidatus Dormibacteraeota bacterium]|nr:DUF6438 domain-containing protein [Candidatus Dormibacteraeota bacterium]